jgi:hypothetical protein
MIIITKLQLELPYSIYTLTLLFVNYFIISSTFLSSSPSSTIIMGDIQRVVEAVNLVILKYYSVVGLVFGRVTFPSSVRDDNNDDKEARREIDGLPYFLRALESPFLRKVIFRSKQPPPSSKSQHQQEQEILLLVLLFSRPAN